MAVNRDKLGGFFDDDKAFDDLWNNTDAAPELTTGPIPAGKYRCRIVSGALAESRSGKTSYKLAFEVIDGDHAGRRIWHDIWLTPAALPYAKPVLEKVGITSPDRLRRPLPSGFIIDARVSLRKGDDGAEHNQIRSFEVVAFEPPQPDPFAPADSGHEADHRADHRHDPQPRADAGHEAEPRQAEPRKADDHADHEADDGELEEFEL